MEWVAGILLLLTLIALFEYWDAEEDPDELD